MTKLLKECRAAEDKRDADEARAFYTNKPDDAKDFFQYTKTGSQREMTTDEAIAKKWRKMKEQTLSGESA